MAKRNEFKSSPATPEILDALIVSPHVDYDSEGQPKLQDYDLSIILPLGAMYVVQHLNDRGYKVAFLHLSTYLSEPENKGLSLEQVLARFPAKICAIQCNWFLYLGGTAEVSRAYRKLFPNAQIIAGGIHATGSKQSLMDNIPELDGIVLGEGERVLESMVHQKNLESIPGLMLRNGQETIPQREHLPISDVSIIDPRLPCFHGVKPSSSFYLNVSRGKCAHHCTYCVANNGEIFQRKLTSLPIPKIIEQLKIYKECDVKEVFLGETQFITRPFLKELAREIIKQKVDIYLRLETHPILFDYDMTKLLIEAGFRRFTMGCESGDPDMLSASGRNYGTNRILKAVETIVEHGGIVLTSWIINLPNETRTQFDHTLKMMNEVADRGGLSYWIENLHVIPGSPLEKEEEKHKIKILLKTFADWRRWAFIAKSNIDFEDALEQPEKYLTHLATNASPREMMERFIEARMFAKELIPKKINFLMNRKDLPTEIAAVEMAGLHWYQKAGYRMLVF